MANKYFFAFKKLLFPRFSVYKKEENKNKILQFTVIKKNKTVNNETY